MKLLNRLLDLIFVPICISCGDRLSTGFLCEKCKALYERRLLRACPRCFKRYSDCTCVPDRLASYGIQTHIKLFAYDPLESKMPENKIIYAMKRQNNRALADFLSDALAARLSPYVQDLPVIITYMPRSRKSVVEYGVDQSQILAKGVAKRLGLRYQALLRHQGSRVQKSLKKKERFENAFHSYAVRKGTRLSGETVVLVDDISTSGATLTAGTSLLRKSGAGEIILLTLAVVSNASFSNIN